MCDQTFGLGSGSGSGLKVGSGSGSGFVSGSMPHDASTEAVSLPMGNQGGEMARVVAREELNEEALHPLATDEDGLGQHGGPGEEPEVRKI